MSFALGTPSRPIKEFAGLVLVCLPALAMVLGVTVYPLVRGSWLSLHEHSLGGSEARFIGWGNFTRLSDDPEFWSAWHHTLTFATVSTVLETLLGLAVAIPLSEMRGRRTTAIATAILLLPWALPPVAASRMFGHLFDGEIGVVNHLLIQLGLSRAPIAWLSEPGYAFAVLVVTDVWKTTPFMILLLSSGLAAIDRTLIHAAHVDGATAWRTFLSVRLPLLAPYLGAVALVRFVDAVRIFDLVHTLTGGGPGGSTEVLSTLTYKRMFSALEIGYGTSIALATLLTETVVALVALAMLRRFRSIR